MSTIVLRFAAFLLIATALAACGNNLNGEPGSSASNVTASSASTGWVKDTQYMDNSRGSCEPSSDTVCMSAQQYQQACESATGLTQSVIKGLANSSGRETNTLVSNGNIESTDIHWDGPTSSCVAYLTAVGTVEGKSLKAHIGGKVGTFVASDDGKLLVSGIDVSN